LAAAIAGVAVAVAAAVVAVAVNVAAVVVVVVDVADEKEGNEALQLLLLVLLVPLALPLAYFNVNALALARKLARFSLYSAVISATSPSSALGVSISNLIVVSTVETFKDGVHDPLGGIFSVSRHILPPESMFGW